VVWAVKASYCAHAFWQVAGTRRARGAYLDVAWRMRGSLNNLHMAIWWGRLHTAHMPSMAYFTAAERRLQAPASELATPS
jgi:hypothetical protein